jgi:hypothetical protein
MLRKTADFATTSCGWRSVNDDFGMSNRELQPQGCAGQLIARATADE